jgi:hypothetical protein
MASAVTVYLMPTDVMTNTASDGRSFSAVFGVFPDVIIPGGGASGPPTHDESASYCSQGGYGRSIDFGVGLDDTFPYKMASITSLTVGINQRIGSGTSYSNSSRLQIKLDGVESSGSYFTTIEEWTQYESSITQSGGGAWIEADLRHSTFEFKYRTTAGGLGAYGDGSAFLTSVYLKVIYIPLNRTIDLERDIATRRLRLNREPEQLVELVTGWEGLEGELMDAIGYSHADGPSHDALGWGVQDWKRGFGRLKKQVISLSVPEIKTTIGDRRRFQCTYWEIGALSLSGDSEIADGLPRLAASSADRVFSRTSVALVEDLGGVVNTLSASKEKIETAGILIEEARTNVVLRSAHQDHWTKTDTTGVTSHAGTLVPSSPLFGSGVSEIFTNVLTVTTAPYDSDIRPNNDPVLSTSTAYTLSVDWHQDQAATTEVAIQNQTTNNWLQSDGGSWGGSRVNIPLGTEVGTNQRDQISFTSESSGTVHRVHVNVTGSVNGAKHIIHHLQIEAGAWMSSRIVTREDSDRPALGTRELDSLLIENPSTLAQRIFPVDKFTTKVRFTPQWNSADPSGTVTILDLAHDANNGIRLEHTTAPALRFVYEHGGTTETASFSSPGLVAGTEYIAVFRKGSTSGELDETSGTCSIFLNGVKGGTTDVAASNLTEVSDSVLQIGSLRNDTQIFNGWIAEVMVSPIVFSDVEIAGGLS